MNTSKKNLLLISTIILGLIVSSQTIQKNVKNETIQTVKIGDQIWTATNLNVEYFSNGDVIPEVKTKTEWIEAGRSNKPAWCYYNNKLNNSKGKLYNWNAVNDKRGLAPKGWHIPKRWEWEKLFDIVGGDSIAGYKLSKYNPNQILRGPNIKVAIKSKNIFKFNAEKVGERLSYGEFNYNSEEIHFWSNSYESEDEASSVYINCSVGVATMEKAYKSNGYSVRCIKN